MYFEICSDGFGVEWNIFPLEIQDCLLTMGYEQKERQKDYIFQVLSREEEEEEDR